MGFLDRILGETSERGPNLCFGRGKWSKTLFITTSKKLYTIEVKKEGFHTPFK